MYFFYTWWSRNEAWLCLYVAWNSTQDSIQCNTHKYVWIRCSLLVFAWFKLNMFGMAFDCVDALRFGNSMHLIVSSYTCSLDDVNNFRSQIWFCWQNEWRERKVWRAYSGDSSNNNNHIIEKEGKERLRQWTNNLEAAAQRWRRRRWRRQQMHNGVYPIWQLYTYSKLTCRIWCMEFMYSIDISKFRNVECYFGRIRTTNFVHFDKKKNTQP